MAKKNKQRDVYLYTRHGNIMAKGTKEMVALKTGKTVSIINNLIVKTNKGDCDVEQVTKIGKYKPIYEMSRNGKPVAKGTLEEIAGEVILSVETIRNYAKAKKMGNMEMKYLGTKFVKLEEDEG